MEVYSVFIEWNTVKMFILPKVIYQNSMSYFTEIEKNPKIHMELKNTPSCQSNLVKE